MAASAGDNTIPARTDASSGTEDGGTAAEALRLGYVILHVPDVPAAVAFYQAAFGLACRFVHPSGYAEMETGMTALAFASHELTEANGLPSSPHGRPFGAEVAFVTGDVTGAFQRALRAGAEAVVTPAARPWGQVVGYVRDLNGFLVELCTPAGA
jgi:lactoylglutathione lyase